jgi:hypothetical protein
MRRTIVERRTRCVAEPHVVGALGVHMLLYSSCTDSFAPCRCCLMFDGEVVVVEVLVVPEVHADVLVVPVVDDLLLVDVYEVHEVTMVVYGLL